MLSISFFAETIKGNRVALNISPRCGDDSVQTVLNCDRKTFGARP
jgi:hypothetical protein